MIIYGARSVADVIFELMPFTIPGTTNCDIPPLGDDPPEPYPDVALVTYFAIYGLGVVTVANAEVRILVDLIDGYGVTRAHWRARASGSTPGPLLVGTFCNESQPIVLPIRGGPSAQAARISVTCTLILAPTVTLTANLAYARVRRAVDVGASGLSLAGVAEEQDG